MTTDFGRDTYCADSLRTGRYASGAVLVGQRCYHRLITPRGMLRGGEEERNFGLDLAGKIGHGVTKNEEAALPGQIQNELRKDAEVLEVSTRISSVKDSAGAVSWTIAISGTTAVGPFELVMGIAGNVPTLVRLTGGA